MKKALKMSVMTIGALLVTAGNSWATIVYDKVELFNTSIFFADPFEITAAGSYLAILTDFEFPAPMVSAGMEVNSTTELLGSLTAPGSFTFDATPGTHFLSFSGFANTSTSLPLGQFGIEIEQLSSVPEPATLILLSLGFAGLGFTQRMLKV